MPNIADTWTDDADKADRYDDGGSWEDEPAPAPQEAPKAASASAAKPGRAQLAVNVVTAHALRRDDEDA